MAGLETCQFSKDASAVENWLISQERYLVSDDYGQTLNSVERLLKRHKAFEKSTGTWDERTAALKRLTTVGISCDVTPCPGGLSWLRQGTREQRV